MTYVKTDSHTAELRQTIEVVERNVFILISSSLGNIYLFLSVGYVHCITVQYMQTA